MKKIPLCLALCIVVFATGCPKYKPSQVKLDNKNSFVTKLNGYFLIKQTEYKAAGVSDKKIIRNQFIEDALPFIDEVYEQFITDIQAGRDRGNFVADLVELGTSAAVGITNGERPLQILGIALTAFRGGRRSADLNFYKEQTTPVLINKMDGNRAKVRAVILIREREEVDTYPIGAAIADIVAYYNAGTLVRAFTELQKDTAVQTKQSEENLEVLKGVRISKPATAAEVADAISALDVLDKLETALNSQVATQQATAVQKLRNIVKALEGDDDVRPVLQAIELSSSETDGQKLLAGLSRLIRKIAPDSQVHARIDQAIVVNGK
jgi:hypothetical protein